MTTILFIAGILGLAISVRPEMKTNELQYWVFAIIGVLCIAAAVSRLESR